MPACLPSAQDTEDSQGVPAWLGQVDPPPGASAGAGSGWLGVWGRGGLTPRQDLQIGDVFGEVAWDAGQLLVGAVHNGTLTATLLGAHEVHEALAAEPAAVIL